MTGLELLEGLSFVDERYIAEAETACLKRGTPWMKVLSVAACICILITGAFAYSQMQPEGAMESITEAPAADMPDDAPAAAAPAEEERYAADAPAEGAPKEETGTEEPAAAKPESAAIPAGELQQIPYACLRIINVLDDGSFEAIVEEPETDTLLFEVGMQVTVVIDPDKVPGNGERTDVANEEIITEDLLVAIENGAYDAGINTLYVEGLLPSE